MNPNWKNDRWLSDKRVTSDLDQTYNHYTRSSSTMMYKTIKLRGSPTMTNEIRQNVQDDDV